MKQILFVVIALALSACGTTQPPAPITKPGYTLNACLHEGKCDGRPYPGTLAVLGQPHRASDEGLGGGAGAGGASE